MNSLGQPGPASSLPSFSRSFPPSHSILLPHFVSCPPKTNAMLNIFRILPCAVLLLGLLACQPDADETDGSAQAPSDYVDPFIGTGDHGHVYPGATLPFGMVQLSPDNGTQGWDWCSGYNYIDSVIVGFSHTHLSGTGIGDLLDVLMMPTTATVDFTKEITDRNDYDYHSAFSHEREQASPGFYQVYLEAPRVDVSLTTTQRVGLHQYVFEQGANASVVLDLAFAINWDKPTSTAITMEDAHTLSGYRLSEGWAKDQRVYFVVTFSEPITNYVAAENQTLLEAGEAIEGDGSRAQLFFELADGDTLLAKVAISTAEVEGARAALDELPHWDFEAVRQQAKETWDQSLNVIQAESMDETIKRVFYTALYHSQLAPVIYSDANGRYKGADNQVHTAEGYDKYGIFSLWDTFRANNPLFTLTQQARVNDMVRSMMDHYREHGLLPVWSLLGNETNTMTGYHAVPVLADAYLKGFRDYDAEEVFEAMKKSAMQDIRATDFLREYDYIPYDKAGQSVTRTLEYCYDDWCIAQMAQALGKAEDYEYFMRRARNYQNLFDPSTGFFRAKLSDGSWKTPFDPKYSSHDFTTAEYTEGNAWQHSWFVPHDVQGMINLHGGREAFVNKLDSLFSIDSEITGENASADISGLIGQYAHGNEPSHHIAYLYAYAGAPGKTQERVRNIMATMYTEEPTGICGNEDCGQMSAWYIFSAMGFYPVNPAEGVYVLGSPLLSGATLSLPDGKQFEVVAHNQSAGNVYVQSVSLNGQELDRTFITHEEIMAGGKLEFEMGATPNEAWGETAQVPPSMSEAM